MKYLLSINYLYWLVVSALLTAAGEFLSKKFAIAPKITLGIFVLLAYTLGTVAWLPAILQKNSLSIVGTIWSVLSLFATILIGVLIFGEKINAYGIAGMVLAVASITLLSIG